SNLQTRVRNNLNDPALKAWYLYDEPENNPTPANPIDPAVLKQDHDWVKAADPAHPITFAAPGLGIYCPPGSNCPPYGTDPYTRYPYIDSLDYAMVDVLQIPNNPPSQVITPIVNGRQTGKAVDFIEQTFSWDINDRWP